MHYHSTLQTSYYQNVQLQNLVSGVYILLCPLKICGTMLIVFCLAQSLYNCPRVFACFNLEVRCWLNAQCMPSMASFYLICHRGGPWAFFLPLDNAIIILFTLHCRVSLG